jgi:hypothetical protein
VSGPSQATQLVELVLGNLDLFHSPDQVAYASIAIDNHYETWPIRTGPFRRWIARRYFDANGAAPSSQPLQDALGVLEGTALFEGEEHSVYTRLGEEDGRIYLDLGDHEWRAVEIHEGGWAIVSPPVYFRRPRGLLPLALPKRGGNIDDLRRFVNVSDEDWPLVVGWQTQALRPRGPYPIALFHGEQGSGKSLSARALRSLIDPNTAPLRSQPREERDLAIAARNGWVMAFDNVSSIPDWLSDAFCRLSTGGGLATRALYTDDDEVLFDFQRPLVLTGIEEVATRGDLIDRALITFLPTIPERNRRAEAKFWADYEKARPRLLGAFLDAAVTALKRHRSVRLDALPRMADFAIWIVAAEPSFGWEKGTFLTAYADKRAEAHELTLEASVISGPVRDLADEQGFLGTATELLRLLDERVGDDLQVLRRNGWPKDATRLSGALRRIAPNLRAVGVKVEFRTEQRTRLIEIGNEEENSVSSVAASHPGSSSDPDDAAGDAGDAGDALFPTHSLGDEGGGR